MITFLSLMFHNIYNQSREGSDWTFLSFPSLSIGPSLSTRPYERKWRKTKESQCGFVFPFWVIKEMWGEKKIRGRLSNIIDANRIWENVLIELRTKIMIYF